MQDPAGIDVGKSADLLALVDSPANLTLPNGASICTRDSSHGPH